MREGGHGGDEDGKVGDGEEEGEGEDLHVGGGRRVFLGRGRAGVKGRRGCAQAREWAVVDVLGSGGSKVQSGWQGWDVDMCCMEGEVTM